MTDRAALVNEFAERRRQGMDYSDIRKELQSRNVEEEEIKIIIRLIDRQDRLQLVRKADASTGNEYFMAGTIALCIGLFILVFSLLSDLDVWILPYGLIFGGGSLMALGRSRSGSKR